MRKIGDRLVLYATDLCNYVACPYVTQLDLRSFTEDLKKAEADEQSIMITQKGLEHEARYLEFLRSSGKSVFEVERIRGASPEDEAERTLEVLKQGHEYVYQAALSDGQFAGYSDFLMRVPTRSDLGDFSYEVIDSKLGNKEKASHLIQLCFYSELLAKTQGAQPNLAHIYLGTRKLRSFRVASYVDYYRRRRADFIRHVTAGDVADMYPEPCVNCATCHWSDHCEQRWVEDDHLSLVANITRAQRKKLVASGIETVAALAATETTKVTGISDDVFGRLREQASLQVACREDGNQPKIQLLPPREGVPGFGHLPDPQEGDLFYDIEGDPLVKEEFLTKGDAKLRDGLEYLHGFTWCTMSGELRYRAFWARSKAAERQCYEELLDFLAKHANAYPDAKIYHYSSYEISALKRLSSQYPTRTEKLDRLLREKRFVDLYKIVKESIRVSEPRYSIKNLERFYSEARDLEVADGGASVVWFEQFLETGDESKLVDIENYNRKDCDSTYELFKWLHDLKRQSAEMFKVDWNQFAKRKPAPDKPRKAKKQKEEGQVDAAEMADERIRGYARAFGIDTIQAKKAAERTDAERFRELLFYLADFFRREMKPSWWQHYEWQDRPTTMFDEPACLGKVTLDPTKPVGSIALSNLIPYVFPVQETKLSDGDQLFDMASLQAYGSIHEIDMKTCALSIKLGNTRTPLAYVELAPALNDTILKLVEGLDRFLMAMQEADLNGGADGERIRSHAALVDILRKKLPAFKDGKERTEIVSVSAGDPNFPKQLLDTALALDDSYLFIQGPPGTGKTYHGARLAKALMERGKRIGVTSNSHKAIHNFLKEVDKVAHEESFSFQGAKKSDKHDERKQYNPKNDKCNPNAQIVDFDSNKKVSFDDLDLLAGTAWTFIPEEHYQKFDYLIVDEASQLSLAHLIAAGISARNLILIGDPQQLPQPLQGVHPGELALSPLEYLLDGRSTVPHEMGVFLDVCRRMHTRICDALSEHVYDGRLQAPKENGAQKILNPNPNLVLDDVGILFHPCKHEGNTSSSPEEVGRVGEIYRELLGCSFRDKDGVERKLSKEDIMVIAPYNVQVNNLRAALGDGAEVGTIDIFQGREAPVVIISMTSSNAEDTPRGIEFLFSQQRINVALSRAKALAIIVGSPRLFSTRCVTPKQMELVNFFCAVSPQ